MQLRERSKQNPAIADGVECVRFGREMDSDNNAPCFSLAGLVWLLAARHQASLLSRITLAKLFINNRIQKHL